MNGWNSEEMINSARFVLSIVYMYYLWLIK